MRDSYTHGHHESVLRAHRWRTVENSAAYLEGSLRPGMRVLDVGCGPGSLTADLARRVAPGTVVGLDSSAAVLAEARERVADAGNVELVAGDVYSLAFPDRTFDLVHAHQVLQHLTDPVEALREMGRVCRPDGIVAARDADYRAMTWWPAEPALDRWMDVYQGVARRNGGEPDAGRRLLSWAGRAGLTGLVPSASVWCFATADSRRWWAGLWAERVRVSDLAEQAIEHGLASYDELVAISAGWDRWSSSDDAWFVVVHGEIIGRPIAR